MAPEPARATARVASVLAALILAASPAHALRVVDWNVLNYPGNTGPARDPLYRTVLVPVGADLLITEEQTSQAGITEFLGSLNTMEPGLWSAAPFVDGNDTDSGLFYKASKVQFLGQWAFYPDSPTNLRYVHVYRLKPVGYSSSAAEFRIYAVHLKASTGYETQRLTEATGIRDSMNALPPGTHAMVVGDFNFYTGLEPAMQKFLESETDNDGRLYDPLGLQGVAWQDNGSMALHHTQSPCKAGGSACASGAATGGLDDRFDLILPTLTFNDGAGLDLVPGSYVSVGNDGHHLNLNITDTPTIPEGAPYASALILSSDHLPVRVDVRLPALLSAGGSIPSFGTVIAGAVSTQARQVTNAATAPGEVLTYTYTAPAGFTAPAGTRSAAAGVTNFDAIGMDTSTPGAKSGTLSLASNSADSPNASWPLSGTVLRHAVPSLDSLAVTLAGTLDFGTRDSADLSPLDVRVFDVGWDALQAHLSVESADIAGGDGRFSIVGGSTPAIVDDTGLAWSVAFDPAGATPDSLYEATLTFATADEALPGATAQASLAVDLRATVKGAGTTGVGDAAPRATLLYPPYPNPLRGTGTLRFDVARAGGVALEVFDVTGRRTATLVRGALEPGRYTARWDGSPDGAPHAGLYFVRLTAPGAKQQTVRLVVVK